MLAIVRRTIAALLLGACLIALGACGEDVPPTNDVPTALGPGDAGDGSGFDAQAALAPACPEPRIRVIYAGKQDMAPGEGTNLTAEITPAGRAADGRLSWWLINDEQRTAKAAVEAAASCHSAVAACARFTCNGMGRRAQVDPATGRTVDGVWVLARYEEPGCFDTSRILLRCTDAP